jgi:Tfp pilus assembly protein PilZ
MDATIKRDERRLFERFSAKFPTKFKNASDDFGVDVFMRDLSASGACLRTRERFFIDDMLSIELELPDGHEPLHLNGRVRWIKSQSSSAWDLGIEFHQVHLMKLHRLVKYAAEVEDAVS